MDQYTTPKTFKVIRVERRLLIVSAHRVRRRAARGARLRIRHLFDKLHKRLTQECLCPNLLSRPAADVSTHCFIVKQADQNTFRQKRWRITNSKTARGMLRWDHFRVRQRLHLVKQHKYPRCNVLTCGEVYTRNAYGGCGCVKANLRAKKAFRCQKDGCGFVCKRDVNGTGNILLRYLTMRCSSDPTLRTSVAA
jgi:hypothetical protein